MNYTKQMKDLKKQMKPTVSTKKNKLDSYTRWLNISYNSKIQERMDELRGDHAHLMAVKKDIKRIKQTCKCQNLHDVADKLDNDYIDKSKKIDKDIPLTNQQAIYLGCLVAKYVWIKNPKSKFQDIKQVIQTNINSTKAKEQEKSQVKTQSDSAIPVDPHGNIRDINNTSENNSQNPYNATNNMNNDYNNNTK